MFCLVTMTEDIHMDTVSVYINGQSPETSDNDKPATMAVHQNAWPGMAFMTAGMPSTSALLVGFRSLS